MTEEGIKVSASPILVLSCFLLSYKDWINGINGLLVNQPICVCSAFSWSWGFSSTVSRSLKGWRCKILNLSQRAVGQSQMSCTSRNWRIRIFVWATTAIFAADISNWCSLFEFIYCVHKSLNVETAKSPILW